jgi:hypothetical protein
MHTWKTLLLFISLSSLSAHLSADEIMDQSLTDDLGYLVMEASIGGQAPAKAYVWFEIRDGEESHLSGTIHETNHKRNIYFTGQSADPGESIRLELMTGEDENDEVPMGYIEGQWSRDFESGMFTLTGHWFMPNSGGGTQITFKQFIPPGSVPIDYHLFEETYTRRRGDDSLDRRVSITFPQVRSNEPVHQRINDVIRQWAAQRLIEPSEKPQMAGTAPSLAKIDQSLRVAMPARKNPQLIKVGIQEAIQLDHEFTILYNQNNLLCLMLNMRQYEGGAHEMFWATHMMFDLRTGSVLEMKDMLKKGWETEVTKMVLEDLRAHYGDSLDEDSSSPGAIREKLKQNEDFFINEEGLGLYFAPYEIGSFALGAPCVVFPLTKISHLIDKGSLLEIIGKNF